MHDKMISLKAAGVTVDIGRRSGRMERLDIAGRIAANGTLFPDESRLWMS